MPGGTQGSRSSSPDGSQDGAQGAEGAEGSQNDGGDIRVASAERPGAGSEAGETGDISAGSEPGGGGQVSSAEALEAANAAVDAAAGAVDDAEATIERAREAVDEQGGSGDSFDPWVEPAQSQASNSKDGGGGEAGESSEETDSGGGQAGEESFDPFAVYDESTGGQSGQPGRPSQRQVSEASLEIADDALATANSALNRARRSLIEAAAAGSGDPDAEAVQLAAARAALEAAAEAVVASAIAVLAAAASMEPSGEPVPTDPAEIQRAMEEFAAGLAMVVGVLHREMTSAAEALDATADLLTAAGSLIAMVGEADLRPREEADEGLTAGERVASLDEELDESLAVFDDRMSAEGSASDPGFGDGEGGLAGIPSGGSADVGSVGSQRGSVTPGSGDRPANRPDGEWAKPEYEGKKPTSRPKDIEEMVLEEGAAQDDDIVARQLREAAAAETDPELRERLWEEYYAYKGSLERGEAETTQ